MSSVNTKSGRLVKVLDFGLAKDIHAVGQDGQTVTSRVTNPGAPSSLIMLIDHCLAKPVGERLQSARLLASALRDISRQPAVAPSGQAAPGITASGWRLDPFSVVAPTPVSRPSRRV